MKASKKHKIAVARFFGPLTRIFWLFIGFLRRYIATPDYLIFPEVNLGSQTAFGPVAVLGRGPSVTNFIQSAKNYETVVVANFTTSDFLYPGICEKIGQCRQLVFLGNRAEETPAIRVLSSLPLTAVVWTGLDRSFNHERQRISGRLSALGRSVQSLPRDFSPLLFAATRNAGLIAVTLAALRSNEVDVYGIDFYESGFLSVPEEIGWPGNPEGMKDYGRDLIDRFVQLVTFFPSVVFTVFTQSLQAATVLAKNGVIIEGHSSSLRGGRK